MSQTLISAQEVIYYTPTQKGMDAGLIKPLVPLREESLFRTWLGFEWYGQLLEDLKDNSTATGFISGSNYSSGALVIWRDLIYEATGNTTGQPPSDTDFWKEADKFNAAHNNVLWRRYLRTVLAWHILHTGLVYNAIRNTGMGVAQPAGEHQVPVNHRLLSSFKAEVGGEFQAFLQTMDAYLREQSATFPKYRGNEHAGDQGNVGKRRRYYGFNLT